MITKMEMRERFPRWYEMVCQIEGIPQQKLNDDGDSFTTPSGLRFDYRTAWLVVTAPDPAEQEKWRKFILRWNRATVWRASSRNSGPEAAENAGEF